MEQELFDVLSNLEMSAHASDALAPDAARFVALTVVSKKAQVMVEVGAGVGYATLWLAYAAQITGGKVITCEIDPAKAAQAQANLAQAKMAQYVEVLVGDARDLLRRRSEPVDVLLIDADFGQYETYFDVAYKRMGVGAVIVAANVIADENALADYITYVKNHPNLESVTLPLGSGLEFTVKTGN